MQKSIKFIAFCQFHVKTQWHMDKLVKVTFRTEGICIGLKKQWLFGVWSMLWSASTLVNQWMFSLMVIRGLVWVGSGDKLHARDHQALPHPVLGLQAGRHWSRHTDTTLKSIREVKGEINTWEMRLLLQVRGQVLLHHLHRETSANVTMAESKNSSKYYT